MELLRKPILSRYLRCDPSSFSIPKNSLYITSLVSISASKFIGLISTCALSSEKHFLSSNSLYAFLLSIFLTLAYNPIEYPPAPQREQQYLLF